MGSSKKSSIPQGELDFSVSSDRGKLEPEATQAHVFVKGQTCKAANKSKSKRQKKAEKRLRKQKDREASSKPKPTGFHFEPSTFEKESGNEREQLRGSGKEQESGDELLPSRKPLEKQRQQVE